MRWSSRSLFAVLAVCAVVAVSPAVLGAFEIEVPWVVSLGAVAAALAALVMGRFQKLHDKQVERGFERAVAREEGCVTLSNGRLPKVGEWADPRDWGVHAAASRNGDDIEPPVYVPRDVDEQVRRVVAKGGFVLLVGESTAGKTRCAYEAVAGTLKGHTLLIPTRKGAEAALRAAAERPRSVLWLNDVHIWESDSALTREAVSQILNTPGRGHRVVVATLRANEETRMLAQAEGSPEGARMKELLGRATRVFVDRRFSERELSRAEDFRWDERVSDALAHADEYGIAEYIANGPQLFAEWENAWAANTDPRAPSNPRAAALIAAAVDVRRCGYQSPIPKALLERLSGHYLTERGGERLSPETVEKAWEWVTRPRKGTTRLLPPEPEGHVGVFDYLVDEAQKRASVNDHVPAHVVESVLDEASADDAHVMGNIARAQGRDRLEEKGHRRAYELRAVARGEEHPSTLVSWRNWASVLRDMGRLEEAEVEFRSVLEVQRRVLGEEHPNTLVSRSGWALVLRDMGRLEEAEVEFRPVLDVALRVLGEEHPNTLVSQNSWVLLLGVLWQMEGGEAAFRSVLDMNRRILGEEHPDTVTSRENFDWVLGIFRERDEDTA